MVQISSYNINHILCHDLKYIFWRFLFKIYNTMFYVKHLKARRYTEMKSDVVSDEVDSQLEMSVCKTSDGMLLFDRASERLI